MINEVLKWRKNEADCFTQPKGSVARTEKEVTEEVDEEKAKKALKQSERINYDRARVELKQLIDFVQSELG